MNCTGIKRALFWGYFANHCQKAKLGNHRAFHVTMAAAEFFPLLSQIVSLIEFLFLKAHQNKNSSKHSINLSKISNETVTTSKTQKQFLTNSKHTAIESSATTSSDSSANSSSVKRVLGTKLSSSNILRDTIYMDPYLYDGKSFDLQDAILEGNIDEVKKLVSQISMESINQKINGYSLLEWAAQKGHLKIVIFLVDSGAKDNVVKAEGDASYWDLDRPSTSALLVAALNGHHEIVKYLLDNGAKDRIFFDYSSILPRVVRTSNLKMVKLLVSYEQNPDDLIHSKAQHTAYDFDHANIYQFLIAQGLGNWLPANEKLLLDAARLDKPHFIKMLIRSGLNIDVQDPETGFSLLHYAACNRNDKLVSWLLAKGANPQLKTKEDYLADSGLRSKINTDYQTFAKYVLDYRAQKALRKILLVKEEDFSNSQFEDIHDCLSCIIDINAKFQGGNTFLHLAAKIAKEFHVACFTALLEQGAIIQKNDEGKTPYDYLRFTMQRLLVSLLKAPLCNRAKGNELLLKLRQLLANAI